VIELLDNPCTISVSWYDAFASSWAWLLPVPLHSPVEGGLRILPDPGQKVL